MARSARRLDRTAKPSHVERVRDANGSNETETTSELPSGRARTRRRMAHVVRWLAFGICLALFVHVLAAADLAAVGTRIAALGPKLLVVLVPFPIALACDAWAWQRLVEALGHRVPLRRIFPIRLATEAVTNSAPAGAVWADALGPLLLARGAGLPIADAFATSTAKRWLIVRTHGVYVAVAAAFGFSYLARASTRFVGNESLLVFVLLGAVTLVLVSLGIEAVAARGRVAHRLSMLLRRLNLPRVQAWVERRHHQFAYADEQLAKLSLDPRATPVATVRISLLWLFEGLETFLILRLLGADLGLVEVISFDAGLSVLRSVALFAPAGIGVQDVGYLAALEAYGVPEAATIGATFIVVKRLKEAFYVLVGFVVLFFLRRRKGVDLAATHPADAPRGVPTEARALSANGANGGEEGEAPRTNRSRATSATTT